MEMTPWLDKEGKPITPAEWEALHEDESYLRIGLDHVGPMEISTVWLGIDHNFSRQGAPILFETMIFGGPLDLYQVRFRTEEEAQRGHRLIRDAVLDGRWTLAFARLIEDGRKRHGMVKWSRDWIKHQRKGI